MAYRKSDAKIQNEMQKILKLTEERGHVFLEGTPLNRESVFVFYCNPCKKEVETTFYNYKRSKTGCPTCGYCKVSEKLIGRVVSEETLTKMLTANQKRPYRGGKPRDWRETPNYYCWRDKVYKLWRNRCAITGEPMAQKLTHEAHHLEGAATHPALTYHPLNGILIKKELHIQFHKKFGYSKTTLEQFQEFIMLLIKETLISSQASPGGEEGSETKAYDPDRIMKLHERLGVISKPLKEIEREDEKEDPNI